MRPHQEIIVHQRPFLRRGGFAALCLISLAVPQRAAAQDIPSLKDRLQGHLDAVHAAGSFPGATIGVALADGRSLGLAVGMADTAAGTRMTPESRMLAGSVGKTWVAALAMQQMGAGVLDLDAPVSRYLGQEPWFRRLPNAAAITVRHLMTHTSGLVRYEFDPRVTEIITAEPDHVWTPVERLSFLFDTEAAFLPGEGWDYSDTNYIVLGMILERLGGAPLYDQIQRRFLEPLGLANTIPSDRRVLPGVVQGYAGSGNPFGGRDAMLEDGRFIMNPQMEWAGGGFASTAEDLARWARLLYTGGAFDAALLPRMLDGVPSRLGPGVRYGLGVILRDSPHGPAQGHSGFFPGYLTEVWYYPEHGLAVAVQVNTSVGRALGQRATAIVDAVAQQIITGGD